MNKKKILLFSIASLLVTAFILPMAAAMRKPNWALDEEEFEGWWIYEEDGVRLDLGVVTVRVWWQIWMNNQTWEDATAAMFIIIEDFGNTIDIVDEWEAFLIELIGWVPEPVVIPGYDAAVIWQEEDVWFGLACYGGKIVVLGGTDETGEPEFPFLSKLKTPTSGSATDEDVEDILTVQGTIIHLSAGIPGFGILPVVITLVVIIGMIIILRKNHLNLLKTI